MGKFPECAHIGVDIVRLILNSGPTASQTTGKPGLDLVLNGFARVVHFPHEISQFVKELIDLAILMLYPLPLDNVKVSAQRLTETGLYQLKEAGPLAVRAILVEGYPI